jgi:5-methylcytosine-specific restriction enzyme subunit McrC
VSRLILNKILPEHFGYFRKEVISEFDCLDDMNISMQFKKQKDKNCFVIEGVGLERHISTSYYVGVDWIKENELAIQIEPKLNDSLRDTNYLSMLSSAMEQPSILDYVSKIYEIKHEQPSIEIEQKNDILTPLLIIQYINVLKEIVKKGLKKDYNKIEQNLYSRIKGKVLVSQTIKENQFKNKNLLTKCQFEVFDENIIENKLLKKALKFSKHYMNTIGLKLDESKISFINPAFHNVSDDLSFHQIKDSKPNVFFKEYIEGIRLAKLIMKRFGYNINSICKVGKIKTPPFWIDMSLLFELYSFNLIKRKYPDVIFQFKAGYGFPDFIIPSIKAIIDAKYKPRYNKFEIDENPLNKVIDDIRQLSGYSRDRKIQEVLINGKNDLLNCYFIYPNIENGIKDLQEFDFNSAKEIHNFPGFYVIGIDIPMQNIS